MTDRTLNDIMEIDHVIRVDAAGNVTEPRDVWAPDVSVSYDDNTGASTLTVSPDSWQLMNGYSGQDRYSGPIMHPSEYIGGGMERDILASPGLYVAVVVYDEDDYNESDGYAADGWAVAYRKDEDG